MKAFLIDFENVKSKGLEGIENLTEDDKVIIFYSENSDTITFEMHKKVLACKADIEYFKVHVGGKNALDFQLSTLLGFLVAKKEFSHIFIISNDKGFDFLHDFWSGNYVDDKICIVFRNKTIDAAKNYSATHKYILDDDELPQKNTPADSIDTAPKEIAKAASTTVIDNDTTVVSNTDDNTHVLSTEKITATLRKYLKNTYLDYELFHIAEAVKNSTDKLTFHNSLAKVFKKRSQEIFNAAKNIFEDIRNNISDFYEDKPCEEIISDNNNEEVSADNDNIEIINNNVISEPVAETADDTVLEQTAEPDNNTPDEIKEKTAPDEQIVFHDVISDKIRELTKNMCNDNDIENIKKCIQEANTKQQLYIKMVKIFKKEKGCEYYSMLKSNYQELSDYAHNQNDL